MRNRMGIMRVGFFCMGAFFLSGGSLAERAWARGQRQSVFEVRELQTQEPRYTLYSTVRKDPARPGHWIQESHGQGHFHTYYDVFWKNTTELVEKDGYLWPVKAELGIFQGETLLERWSHTFDFLARKIKFEISVPPEKMSRTYTFPIKGLTTDYTSMALFLEDLVPRITPERPGVFLLVTSEPRLYRVNMKYVHAEELLLPAGRRQTVKYRLIADMGILDDVFDKLVPPTFIWFDAAPPYHCVKYQGMETGEGSAVVDAQLVEESVLP